MGYILDRGRADAWDGCKGSHGQLAFTWKQITDHSDGGQARERAKAPKEEEEEKEEEHEQPRERGLKLETQCWSSRRADLCSWEAVRRLPARMGSGARCLERPLSSSLCKISGGSSW